MRILMLLVFLLTIVNCKETSENKKGKEEFVIKTLEKENDFKKCIEKLEEYNGETIGVIKEYVIENDSGFFLREKKLDKSLKCLSNFFKETKAQTGDDFFYDINHKIYYPFFKKNYKENFIVIGSFVQFYGENDIPGVFFQLNVLDKKGEQIDYLIVYSRFAFEISYQYDFSIKNEIIGIKKHIEEYDIEEDKITEIIDLENYYELDKKGVFQKLDAKSIKELKK